MLFYFISFHYFFFCKKILKIRIGDIAKRTQPGFGLSMSVTDPGDKMITATHKYIMIQFATLKALSLSTIKTYTYLYAITIIIYASKYFIVIFRERAFLAI